MKIKLGFTLSLVSILFFYAPILAQNTVEGRYGHCNYSSRAVTNIYLGNDQFFQYNSNIPTGFLRPYTKGQGKYQIIDDQIYFHFDSSRTELK